MREPEAGDRSRSLPDPPRARRHFPIISTDDHLVEPPDMFEGRLPAKFAEQAPRVVDHEGGGQAWLYDGHVNPQIGLAAVAGRPIEECSYEPVRFDEMRRGVVGHRHARPRHGPRRRVRVGVLPLRDARLLRPPAATRRERSRARARGDARVERLAPRSVGGRVPRPLHPVPDPVAARPRGRGRGGAPQRGAWLQGDLVQREPRATRPAVDPHRLLGSAAAPRARRPRPSCACTSGRRAPRPPRRATRRATASACCSSASRCSPRSTGSTRRSRCGSPTSSSASPKAASVGWPGLLDRLDHVGKYQADLRHVGGHRPHAARGDAAELLVLLARGRRRPSTCSTTSVGST